MSHPLVLALFSDPSTAADAAAALHALGVSRESLSVVAHTHADAQALADRMDAMAGVDLEDSRAAARLGEVGGRVLATVALAMPGIGPIVAAGPLAAEFGELSGHAAGSLAGVLAAAGLPRERADALQRDVTHGAVLLGVHIAAPDLARVEASLTAAGAVKIETVSWGT